MMWLAKERAKVILDAIRGRKVLVFGDLMLDEYLFGEVNRISPEAPVPIIRVTGERQVLGGAANVASNLKALGAEPLLVGTIGNDAAGARICKLLSTLGVDENGLVQEPLRPTIIKTRVIGQHQQMLRIDREEAGLPCAEAIEGLQGRIRTMIQAASAVIVSDYAKGTVGRQVVDTIREQAGIKGVPWVVDPKPAHGHLYFGASAITPNTKELSELTALPANTDDEMATASSELVAKLGLAGLLVTRSEKGMALVMPEAVETELSACAVMEQDSPQAETADMDARASQPFLHSLSPVALRGEYKQSITIIPTYAREVFDVSGAGDTVIAAFTAALAAKTSWLDAAMLANTAAGVVVGKMGTATASPQEILDRL